jgi:hypothetical protein
VEQRRVDAAGRRRLTGGAVKEKPLRAAPQGFHHGRDRVASRSDIRFQVEGESPTHLLALLLVTDLLLPAVRTPVGTRLTTELIPAIPAHVYRDFLHCAQSYGFMSDSIYPYTSTNTSKKGSGTLFAMYFAIISEALLGMLHMAFVWPHPHGTTA